MTHACDTQELDLEKTRDKLHEIRRHLDSRGLTGYKDAKWLLILNEQLVTEVTRLRETQQFIADELKGANEEIERLRALLYQWCATGSENPCLDEWAYQLLHDALAGDYDACRRIVQMTIGNQQNPEPDGCDGVNRDWVFKNNTPYFLEYSVFHADPDEGPNVITIIEACPPPEVHQEHCASPDNSLAFSTFTVQNARKQLETTGELSEHAQVTIVGVANHLLEEVHRLRAVVQRFESEEDYEDEQEDEEDEGAFTTREVICRLEAVVSVLISRCKSKDERIVEGIAMLMELQLDLEGDDWEKEDNNE